MIRRHGDVSRRYSTRELPVTSAVDDDGQRGDEPDRG